jgi:Recombination endonuclease VII
MRGRKKQDFCKRGHDQSRWRKGPYGALQTSYCEKCRRQRRKTYKKYDQNKKLRQRYGITIEQRDEMLVVQHGACALCDTTQFGARGPMVDHDHLTGRVRGILCGRCNTNLAWLERYPQILDKVGKYTGAAK